MSDAIYAALRPVRARQQRLFALRCVAVGLLAGGVVGAAVVMLAWPLAGRDAEASAAPVPDHILALAADQKEKLAGLDKKLSETAQDLDDEKAEDDKKGLKELLDKLAEKVEELNQPGT